MVWSPDESGAGTGFHVVALLFWIWAGDRADAVPSSGDRLPYKFFTYGQLILVLWMMWELVASEARVPRPADRVRPRRLRSRLRDLPGVPPVTWGHCGGSPRAVRAATIWRWCSRSALPMAWYLGMTYRQPLLRWICRAIRPGRCAHHRPHRFPRWHAGDDRRPLDRPALHDPALARPPRDRPPDARCGRCPRGVIRPGNRHRTARHHPDGSPRRRGSAGGVSCGEPGLRGFPEHPVFGFGTVRLQVRDHAQARPGGPGGPQLATCRCWSSRGSWGFLLYMSMFVAAWSSRCSGCRSLERRFALVLLGTLGVAMFPLTWEGPEAVWFVLAALLGFTRAEAEAATPQPFGSRVGGGQAVGDAAGAGARSGLVRPDLPRGRPRRNA